MSNTVFNLDEREVKASIVYDGKTYNLFEPQVKHTALVEKVSNLNDKNLNEQITNICAFLEAMGLPKDVSSQLSYKQLHKLLSSLTDLDDKKKEPKVGP